MKVCLLLSLSLLLALSSSACSALCLRMQHPATGGMAAVHSAEGMVRPVSHTPSTMDATDRPGVQRLCCLSQHTTDKASPAAVRSAEDAAASPFDAGLVPRRPAPTASFDSPPEKPGYLTPSLTALSISRT